MGSLDGKVAIITGGNGSLGKETALALAGRGAEVVVTCRQIDVGHAVVEEIKAKVPGAKVSAGKLDLGSQESVREFADEFKKSGRPLHILVANAGSNFPSKRLTPDGVPLLCQVNYLGHYTLTRLLEPVLISSAPSRIVSVSSVTHRLTTLPSVAAFLSRRDAANYPDTKLAQVYFTYEAQRRLGPLGVDASAVDPGGVRTNIWKGRYARPPISWYIQNVLAPPVAGAKAVVHAATANFATEGSPKSRWPEANRRKDQRFYVKGAFGLPLMTRYEGPTPGILGTLAYYLYLGTLAVHGTIDWPVQSLSRGRLLSQPRRVLSGRHTYDPAIAEELWDLSAEIAKLPAEPQNPPKAGGKAKS